MKKLVSIVIPCFNAERWISEAIESCLAQTYLPLELIVVNDGSTDASLNIIRHYERQLIWKSTPNKGGSAARNIGLGLATGDFVQFLDADDYLLPEKLHRQVTFLEETGADIVYGDWRHQFHQPDGKIHMGSVIVSGEQTDILESLLRNWWVAPVCLLFRRTIVELSNGWDENLKAGQDRDFFLSLVMAGAHVVYQPGCYSVYRRYGDVTVSTSNKRRFLEGHRLLLEKATNKLNLQGRFAGKYRRAVAESYVSIARNYLDIEPSIYTELIEKTLALCPDFESQNHTVLYRCLQRMIGFRKTEKVFLKFNETKLMLQTLFDIIYRARMVKL